MNLALSQFKLLTSRRPIIPPRCGVASALAAGKHISSRITAEAMMIQPLPQSPGILYPRAPLPRLYFRLPMVAIICTHESELVADFFSCGFCMGFVRWRGVFFGCGGKSVWGVWIRFIAHAKVMAQRELVFTCMKVLKIYIYC